MITIRLHARRYAMRSLRDRVGAVVGSGGDRDERSRASVRDSADTERLPGPTHEVPDAAGAVRPSRRVGGYTLLTRVNAATGRPER